MVKTKASTSDYWYYTGLLLAQFKGLQLGYDMVAPPDQVHCVVMCIMSVHVHGIVHALTIIRN